VKNYYEALELTRSASFIEIRKAYRRLALIWHPDKNPSENAPAKFQAITEAYSVLKSVNSKFKYDQLFDLYHSKVGIDATKKFVRKQAKRERTVHDKARKGRYRAEQQSTEMFTKFEKRKERGSFFNSISPFLDVLYFIFSIFG